MHQQDPLRPRNMRGLPMLLWQQSPVAIIPSLILSMYADQKVHIGITVAIASSTGRTYYKTLSSELVPQWLELWWNDPESILLELGWTFNSTSFRAQPEAISLSDLGL